MFHPEFRNLIEQDADNGVPPIFGPEVVNYAIGLIVLSYILYQLSSVLLNNLFTPGRELDDAAMIGLGFIAIVPIWVSHIVCDMFYNRINDLNNIIEEKNKKIEELQEKMSSLFNIKYNEKQTQSVE